MAAVANRAGGQVRRGQRAARVLTGGLGCVWCPEKRGAGTEPLLWAERRRCLRAMVETLSNQAYKPKVSTVRKIKCRKSWQV